MRGYIITQLKIKKMSLKSIINSIGGFFAHLFAGLLPELKAAIHIGVTVTEAIKTFDTNNPMIADIITSIIPGTFDDKIKETLRAELPKIVTELKLVDATLGLTDPNQIVAAAVKVLQQMSGDYKSAFLNSLSIIIAQVAADGKLDWNDAAYLLKWYYDHNKATSINKPTSAEPVTTS